MAILVTGATGYIGSYVVTEILHNHPDRLALLVRAGSREEAAQRLWKSLQLHMGFDEFFDYLKTRIDIYVGDITRSGLGLDSGDGDSLVRATESVIHCAAALNRLSAKVCFNVNLRGTLEVIKLARAAHDHHGLRRFSDVSVAPVCGKRQGEVIHEDTSIDWNRSDYDPYVRTKKFCEHMVEELLHDVPRTTFRPATILGDSRFSETTQFDPVRAYVVLAHLPLLPLDANCRMDITPADYVGRAIAVIHQLDRPRYGVYHTTAGIASLTHQQITDALYSDGFRIPHLYLPYLKRPFAGLVNLLSNTPHGWNLSLPSALLKVFLPYLTFDTVFDNARVVEELGEAPVPFDRYAYALLQFALRNRFTYPHVSWPDGRTP
jgi:thioester reductase-like protein